MSSQDLSGDLGGSDSIVGSLGSDVASFAAPAPQPGVRPPFHTVAGSSSAAEHGALVSRYRYYSRLDPRSDSTLIMPAHVIPANFFSLIPFAELGSKQPSLVTIFSIWNTMMGTALLTMPWALNQAGLVLGLIFIVLTGVLAYYTAYRVVDDTENSPVEGQNVEFADVCRYYYGKWGERVALLFSLLSLVGATIVYWVLMSNFLFYTGSCIYEAVNDSPSSIVGGNSSMGCDVVCASKMGGGDLFHDSILLLNSTETFYKVWQLNRSVPWFLVLLIFPLLNFESPTFFTKFNGFGTISVFYLLIFVSVKLKQCGAHISFAPGNVEGVELFKTTFPSLTGTLALSYFIHNCIVTILKNQKTPANNARDLGVAYTLVCFTYTAVALVFFVAFPLPKDCIADNFLNNFGPGDLLSAVARVFLLFQMMTVFPLLCFLIRIQFFYAFFGSVYPSVAHVLALNGFIVLVGILFAMFLPSVGSVLRFVGSASGLVYVFALPSLVHLKRLKYEGRLRWYSTLFHGTIIVAGVANLISQFIR